MKIFDERLPVDLGDVDAVNRIDVFVGLAVFGCDDGTIELKILADRPAAAEDRIGVINFVGIRTSLALLRHGRRLWSERFARFFGAMSEPCAAGNARVHE